MVRQSRLMSDCDSCVIGAMVDRNGCFVSAVNDEHLCR